MFAKQRFAVRIAVLLIPGLLAAAPAASQGERGSNRPGDTSTPSGKAVPQAPVGHRQPTAADVPKDLTRDVEAQTREKRDRELDSKLQICRGC